MIPGFVSADQFLQTYPQFIDFVLIWRSRNPDISEWFFTTNLGITDRQWLDQNESLQRLPLGANHLRRWCQTIQSCPLSDLLLEIDYQHNRCLLPLILCQPSDRPQQWVETHGMQVDWTVFIGAGEWMNHDIYSPLRSLMVDPSSLSLLRQLVPILKEQSLFHFLARNPGIFEHDPKAHRSKARAFVKQHLMSTTKNNLREPPNK